ncbi:hypothetical protein RhiirC2_779202 [Rhizophagus irregularis]|uniref:Uncharacterized protein n=1 Tax=Rhizophagus irregularis TaxID=588596 RepID=A0A2N1NA80_9GLOM|nr:hypothetical protein RhiirC2_779202 [Rhizophagus irregularis]
MKVILPIKSFDTHSVTINDDDNGDESQQDISEIEFEEEVGNVGDRISIRLSEDGRNVERKQKLVMLTRCILNEGEAVLNPNHRYR